MDDVSYFTVDKRARERQKKKKKKKKDCISIMDDARYCCVNIKKNDFFYEMMGSDTYIYFFFILFDY